MLKTVNYQRQISKLPVKFTISSASKQKLLSNSHLAFTSLLCQQKKLPTAPTRRQFSCHFICYREFRIIYYEKIIIILLVGLANSKGDYVVNANVNLMPPDSNRPHIVNLTIGWLLLKTFTFRLIFKRCDNERAARSLLNVLLIRSTICF